MGGRAPTYEFGVGHNPVHSTHYKCTFTSCTWELGNQRLRNQAQSLFYAPVQVTLMHIRAREAMAFRRKSQLCSIASSVLRLCSTSHHGRGSLMFCLLDFSYPPSPASSFSTSLMNHHFTSQPQSSLSPNSRGSDCLDQSLSYFTDFTWSP